MERIYLAVVFLTFSLLKIELECKLWKIGKLEGYKFSVHTTEFCPRNRTEWNKRSSVFNCSRESTYACFPNDNISELIEFCYPMEKIAISRGLCLFLSKRRSELDSYECKTFEYGCPDRPYLGSSVYKYSSCLTLGNGCFLAESFCKSATAVVSQELTTQETLKIRSWKASFWIVLVYAIILLLLCFVSCILIHKKRSKPERYSPKCDQLIQIQEDITCCTTYDEKKPGRNIFKKWQNEDELFVPTKACNAVEQMLNYQNLVIVAGHYGSGKKSIVQHIALKYKKNDWIVKPVNAVDELSYASPYSSRKKTLFVLNAPIGKESLDEVLYNSLRKCQETMQCFIPNVKVLVTCRKSSLEDVNVPRSNIIIIDEDRYKLNIDEKRRILEIHNSNQAFSKIDLNEILKIETCFPLLCKLSANNKKHSEGLFAFFSEINKVFQEEIKNLRSSNTEAYCGLVYLVLFNDKLSLHGLEENDKQFKECLNFCDLPNDTSPRTILDNLDRFKDFFVRKIGDAFHFYNVFIKEAAVVVFGTDYQADVIRHADIRALQRIVRFENCVDFTDSFMITLSENHIGSLADRFIRELFGNRFMAVVLSPCLRNTKIVNALIEKLEEDKINLDLMARQIEAERLIIEPWDAKNKQWSTRVTFVTREKRISPLFALIAFCHNEISSFCLKQLKKTSKEISDKSLFFAVFCNGSKNIFSIFPKKDIKNCFQRKWGSHNPIDILSLFHNHELLHELLTLDDYRKLVNKKESIMNSLPLAFEYNAEQNIHIDSHRLQSALYKTIEVLLKNGCEVNGFAKNGDNPLCMAAKHENVNIARLLLDYGAELNLCNTHGDSPLSIACGNGYVSTVDLLLNRGADVSLCNLNGVNPLYMTCLNGHASIVQLLLQKGAKIDSCDEYENSPLSAACENGHVNTVRLLINHGARINQFNKNRVSALSKACANGHARTVQLLLQRGADLNLCDKHGNSPISVAFENGHKNIVEILIRFNKRCCVHLNNEQKANLLSTLCALGKDEIVHLFLKNGINLGLYDNEGKTALYKACENGQDSTVQVLLKDGADTNVCNEDKDSPLGIACEKRYEGIVKRLLKSNADVNSCDRNKESPLFRACQYGDERIVQHLLSSGAIVNLFNNAKETPLFKACEKGYENIVKLLLRKTADVSLCDTQGISPLSIASEKGHASIVRLLLENGSNVNSCDIKGETPLAIACYNKHYDTVNVLIAKGADVNSCNTKKISPLFTACVKGDCNIVHLLLESGAKVNLCDTNGVTPLHIACEYEHYDTVKVLMEKGGDVNICDKKGISPINYAREKGLSHIMQLLVNNTV
uniref:Uncharacterized protein LOC111102281 isoform X2 n=1 Tax=Crassostrea virginica TaxID=6565 RepID=A0A8B8AH70_CRAVI|nr:uncharacterized protein LOC111102281 isoform X2 [Crassostrea virginica]